MKTCTHHVKGMPSGRGVAEAGAASLPWRVLLETRAFVGYAMAARPDASCAVIW